MITGLLCLTCQLLAYSLSKKNASIKRQFAKRPRKLVPSKKNKSLVTIAKISFCKIQNIVISRKNLVFHGIDMFVGWEDGLAKICDRTAFLNPKIT